MNNKDKIAEGKKNLSEKVAEIKKKVKEPIKSAQDANERKKYFKGFFPRLLVITLVAGIGAGLLEFIPTVGAILSIPLSIIGFVAILLLFGDIFMIYLASKACKLYENITCVSCGNQISYGDNVAYKVTNVRETLSDNSERAQLKEYTTVHFDCICQVCGAKKSFPYVFCTRRINATTRRAEGKDYPLEQQIEDYFNGKLTIVG